VSVERWFSRLQPRTAKVFTWIFNEFLKWLKVNGGKFSGSGPDELVDWQRSHPGEYELLDLVQSYITRKDGTYGYKLKCYGCLRSFFLHNRCELPRDKTFRVVGTRPAVMGRLTVDEFRQVLAASNPLYRAIFLCMFQGGMGVEELLYFDRTGLGPVWRQIDGHVHPVRVELPGRKKLKNVKPYYTFLGRDAVDALRKWFEEVRPNTAGKRIFCTQFGNKISYNAAQMYWLDKLEGLGLIRRPHDGNPSNRYGKNLHEIRDLFKTRWRISGVDIEIGDYFMGHDIDSLGYDKSPRDYPDFYRESYERAEPWLNVVTEDPEKVPRSEVHKIRSEVREELDGYKAFLKKLGYAEELEEKLKRREA
jgi:hypothetical protein